MEMRSNHVIAILIHPMKYVNINYTTGYAAG